MSWISFLLTTNYPGVIPIALKSRLEVIVLKKYTADELREIIRLMFSKARLSLDEDGLQLLTNSCRGTARPIEKMLKKFITQFHINDDPHFNKDRVLSVMRASEILPLGVSGEDLKVLLFLELAKNGIFKNMRINLSMENKVLEESLSFLGTPLGLTKKPLVAGSGSVFFLTQNGKSYLKSLRELSFIS